MAITFLNRGIAFARQGFFAKAIEDFDGALLLKPSDGIPKAVQKNIAAAYGNIGVLCAEAKQYREALRFFQWALQADPSSQNLAKNLSLTMIALSTLAIRDFARSTREEIFKRPLMLGLSLSECLNAHGASLANLGKFAEAKGALEGAIKADQQNDIPRRNLEVLLARTGSEVFAVGVSTF